MPSREPVNHCGRKLGPFVVLERAPRKRYWWMECERGHLSSRRIDNMLRAKPETLRCMQCLSTKPVSETFEAFRNFILTLQPESLRALRQLLSVQSPREAS